MNDFIWPTLTTTGPITGAGIANGSNTINLSSCCSYNTSNAHHYGSYSYYSNDANDYGPCNNANSYGAHSYNFASHYGSYNDVNPNH